jgi:hypothetical protein
MSDRYDWERERPRDRGWVDERRREEENREREWRGGHQGDWGGSERGWEGRSRGDEWSYDRRSERGGLDRGGAPGQNREEWGSRSGWGYGARGPEDWSRGERDFGREYQESGPHHSRRDWDVPGRHEGNWGSRETWREGGWNDARYGGRQNWTAGDRERGIRYDWGRSGIWSTEPSVREEPERYRTSSGYQGGASHIGSSGMGGLGTYGERGRFAGRGPKGWQRSDDRIREDVNEQLTRHPEIDATNVEVQVQLGEVTLSGTVDDRRAKRLAEDIAENVSGVKQVHNQLRIGQLQQSTVGGAAHSTPEVTASKRS